MSSLLEKSTTSVIEKRGFFLRTSSIQKLKCTATYPFRLAGTKINRDVVKELIETVIIKARVVSQKALLSFYVATFKVLETILSFWIGLHVDSAKVAEGCDKANKTESNLRFSQRLLLKIQKLRTQRKIRTTPKKLLPSCEGCDKNEKNVPAVNTSLILQNSRLQRLPTSSDQGNCLPSAKTSNGTHKCNHYFLAFFVYGSAAFVYLQLLLLGIALNTTKVPPGLVFLITSLLLIAIIAFKVFFIEKVKKAESKSIVRGSSQGAAIFADKTDASRQSRSRLKKVPVIDFDSKTLSKVKLL